MQPPLKYGQRPHSETKPVRSIIILPRSYGPSSHLCLSFRDSSFICIPDAQEQLWKLVWSPRPLGKSQSVSPEDVEFSFVFPQTMNRTKCSQLASWPLPQATIGGFHVTSLKFKLQNYWSSEDCTFMMCKSSWKLIFIQMFAKNGFFALW